MSKTPKPSVVIFAKNIAHVAKFYEEIASMSIVFMDIDHLVLDAEYFQVVIHGIPQEIAETIKITEPPLIRDNMPMKLCLPVISIAEARAKALTLGGQVKPKSKEWEAHGFRACDGCDPEGNVIQVRESAT